MEVVIFLSTGPVQGRTGDYRMQTGRVTTSTTSPFKNLTPIHSVCQIKKSTLSYLDQIRPGQTYRGVSCPSRCWTFPPNTHIIQNGCPYWNWTSFFSFKAKNNSHYTKGQLKLKRACGEVWTHDIKFGKLVLYQLSYTRKKWRRRRVLPPQWLLDHGSLANCCRNLTIYVTSVKFWQSLISSWDDIISPQFQCQVELY